MVIIMVDITQPGNRTFVYEDSFFQINDGASTDTIKFIQDWNFTPSMDDFDIDRIDTADPIFSKKSDIIGTFSFLTKNTVDIYDTTDPSSDLLTATNWIKNIAAGEPTSITIISILTSPKDGAVGSNSFVTVEWTGRIMSTPLVQVRDTGVQEYEVIGEITAISEVKRTAAT